MKRARFITPFALAGLLCLTGCEDQSDPAIPTQSAPNTTERSSNADKAVDADNTARNRGDGREAARTPMSQSESREHLKTTADIRKAVIDSDSLSVTAKNCKIVTDETGLVTLRGVVQSTAEKAEIGTIAASIAGESRVDNRLEVNTD